MKSEDALRAYIWVKRVHSTYQRSTVTLLLYSRNSTKDLPSTQLAMLLRIEGIALGICIATGLLRTVSGDKMRSRKIVNVNEKHASLGHVG